jgi:hypothetical protein
MERDQNLNLCNENDKKNDKKEMKRKFSEFCEDDIHEVRIYCKFIFNVLIIFYPLFIKCFQKTHLQTANDKKAAPKQEASKKVPLTLRRFGISPYHH